MFTNAQTICHYVAIPEHLKDILHNYSNWSLTSKTVAYIFCFRQKKNEIQSYN